MIHQCNNCNYETEYKGNLSRHEEKKHGMQPGSNTKKAPVSSTLNKQTYVSSYQNPHTSSYNTPRMNYHDEMDVEDEDYPNDDLSESDTDSDADSEGENISDIIEDLRSTFRYINDLKKQYRKLLPQLNELNDKELKGALKSYAALEVSVLDERDGIEDDDEEGVQEEEDDDNDNEEEEDEEDGVEEDNEEGGEDEEEGQEDGDNCNECKKEHFWDFILEARDILKDNKKELLEKYINIAEKQFLDEKDIEEDSDVDDNNELRKQMGNVEDITEDFEENAEECFDTCSKTKVKSVCGMVETLIHPEVGDKLKKYNPRKFEYVRKLLNPFRHSIRKLADPAVTVHEKRKTLKKAQVGEGVLTALTGLLLPLLTDIITNKKRKLDSV